MAFRLELCCNNPDNGMPLGRASAVEFHAGNFDARCVLTHFTLNDYRDGVKLTLLPTRPVPANRMATHLLRFGREKTFVLEYRGHFGNWCWDAAWIAGVDALRIANYLMRLKGWRCEEAPENFYEKFNARMPLAYEDLQ
jgi:hypothetical protein